MPGFKSLKHFLAERRVLDQVEKQLRHGFRRPVVLLEQASGAGFFKSPGVEILVIVRRRRVRDKDGGQARGGQFSE